MKPEIVAYAKERYEEEHRRFDHMEEKCGKLMSFTTILITALAGLLAYFSTAFFSPKGLLDWAILIVTQVLAALEVLGHAKCQNNQWHL